MKEREVDDFEFLVNVDPWKAWDTNDPESNLKEIDGLIIVYQEQLQEPPQAYHIKQLGEMIPNQHAIVGFRGYRRLLH